MFGSVFHGDLHSKAAESLRTCVQLGEAARRRAVSKDAHCLHCGQVIGVYEPLIRLVEGRAQETSRVLDPQVAEAEGHCYHRACYERLGVDQPCGG